MKANFIVVFICTLLIATALPAVGNEIFYTAEVPSPLGVRAWSDDFDSYATGSALHGQGGWEGWDNDPQLGAYVVDDPFLSEPHSVDIAGNSDLVHEFSGYASGEWIFTAWAYVPGDLVGLSYFILLSDYADVDPGTNSKWAVQMWFDPVLGIVTVDDGDQLALITDQWVEIRVEIDLETDWHQVFYDGLMLYEKAWTAGPFNAGDGILNIGAVDLFANSATSVYYDDLSLEEPPPLSCSANGPYEGIVDEEIQFDGSASGGQTPYEYLWDFGDSATSTEEDPTHIYTEPGEFTVTLTVTDADQTQVTDETTATIQGFPILDIRPLTGGLLKATGLIRNQGTAEAVNVDWTITVSGGLILLGGTSTGTIASIPTGGQAEISTGLIFGLSLSTTFVTTAEEDGGASDERSQTGSVLLFFVNVNPGGG